ncbi:hypothetical protein [Streptomyces sp. NPDC047065]|uniref:hypothetical protein n=1 Tax=Streptomyces sp. NPDC047065 TaxID=3154606 RepID=UPI0033EB0BFF
MTAELNWESGEGLLGIDDPAAWDAACERGERHLGTAVIGLAFNCPLEEASPRIVRAMRLPDAAQRGFAYTAAGSAARLHGELTPELYAALRAAGPGRRRDALEHVMRALPAETGEGLLPQLLGRLDARFRASTLPEPERSLRLWARPATGCPEEELGEWWMRKPVRAPWVG